jgi:drug/metabolite transporter (DMT)-like permease
MGVLICFLVVVFAGTIGEIAVTHTMKQIGEVRSFHPRAMLRTLGHAFRHRMMWAGILLMALGFFSLLALLSWENVSLVVPATALSYAVGALGAKFLLGERVDRLRWMGVLLVVVGVALVWFG